ncbi:MAG: site-specific integrase [Dermatophilaceae bacterium]
MFDRKSDAVAWEQDQRRQLRGGEWLDPRRGRVTLAMIEPEWSASRQRLKRKTREADASAWERHIRPRFGRLPVASITPAQVEHWVGGLVGEGLSTSTANRYLSTLRSVLAFAIADGRIRRNPAGKVRLPSGGRARREGEFLTVEELGEFAQVCHGRYADVVEVLGLCGLRWGELAGLQVGDRVSVPGPGLRLKRTVLASSSDGSLYVDTLKGRQARTVALPASVVAIVDRWSAGKASGDWLFGAPGGGPLSESNWRRSVRWSAACISVKRPRLRPHDLRHTAASIWLGAGADPKVVQRMLGHASAAMTMDLYGHLIDANLWEAARRVGGTSGAPEGKSMQDGAEES